MGQRIATTYVVTMVGEARIKSRNRLTLAGC